MFLVGYSLFVGIGFLEKVRVGKNITRYETIRRPLSPPPPPPPPPPPGSKQMGGGVYKKIRVIGVVVFFYLIIIFIFYCLHIVHLCPLTVALG